MHAFLVDEFANPDSIRQACSRASLRLLSKLPWSCLLAIYRLHLRRRRKQSLAGYGTATSRGKFALQARLAPAAVLGSAKMVVGSRSRMSSACATNATARHVVRTVRHSIVPFAMCVATGLAQRSTATVPTVSSGGASPARPPPAAAPTSHRQRAPLPHPRPPQCRRHRNRDLRVHATAATVVPAPAVMTQRKTAPSAPIGQIASARNGSGVSRMTLCRPQDARAVRTRTQQRGIRVQHCRGKSPRRMKSTIRC